MDTNCVVCCEDNLKIVSSRIYIKTNECNIQEIIEKHLGWWQLLQPNDNPPEPWICIHCYHDLTAFNNFYNRVESINQKRCEQIRLENAAKETENKLGDAEEIIDADNDMEHSAAKRIKMEREGDGQNINMAEFTIVDIKTEPGYFLSDEQSDTIMQALEDPDSTSNNKGTQTNFVTLDATDFRDEIKDLFQSELKVLRRSIQYDKTKLVEQLVVLPGDNSKTVSDYRGILNINDPFNNLQCFFEFDNRLRNDKEFLDCLRELISIKIRTKSLTDAIGAVVSMIITPEVQMRFSACGKPTKGVSKENFSATKTYTILKDYLLVQFATESEQTVLSKTSRWFAAAKDRNMGRKMR